MHKIIIGFSRPNKWKLFSWLIRTSYNTDYSHVFIRLHSDTYDRDLVYQASGTTVNFMGMSVFKSHNIILDEFEIDIDEEQKKAMIQFAIDNAGKPYGIKDVIGLGLVRLAELAGKSIKNPFRDSKSTYVCSELVSYIIKDYSELDLPKHPSDMTPKDLYDFMVVLRSLREI
jgi:hypothetical protein